MQPPALSPAAQQAPNPDPVPPVQAQLVRPATRGSSGNHLAGEVDGRTVSYADTNAAAWYSAPAAGWEVRNHRRLRRRPLSSAGDSDERGLR